MILGVLQFYYLYQLYVFPDIGGFSFTWATVGLVILSIFTVILLFQVIASLFSFSRIGLIISGLVYLILYGLLVSYHFGAKELLEWSIIADNLNIAFSRESLTVILHSLDTGGLIYIGVFSILFGILEYYKKFISKSKQEKPYWAKVFIGLVIYLALLFSPINSYDPFINFFRSVYYHYFRDASIKVVIPPDQYPFCNKGTSFLHTNLKGSKPHIFLILVESLNANVIDRTEPNGKSVTPFLNQLKNESIYIPHFYANSIQTAKGHFAILFSVIPSISGKVYQKYPDINLKSIGSVLQKAGYDTMFFEAHDNIHFDNTHYFLTHHGFNKVKTVTKYLNDDDNKTSSIWGVSDENFYKGFFDYWDHKKFKKPQFIVLSTIANHYPFEIPQTESDRIYPPSSELKNPTRWMKQNYANSVHLTDRALKQFFEELKKRNLLNKSIIIMTGDHPFPLGEHGNYHLEAGYHEESFRTPFFLMWEGHLKPRILKDAFSQMDIAPTLVDLLSLEIGKNQFGGISIFDANPRHPIFCIQPYGKQLCVIAYPLKYRFHEKTNREFLYNLETDPLETTNIISKATSEQKTFFRSQIQHIYLNQDALRKDQFLPK